MSEAAPVLYGPSPHGYRGVSQDIAWFQSKGVTTDPARNARPKDLHFLPLPTAALPLLSPFYANRSPAVFFLQIIKFSKTLVIFLAL